MSLFGDAECLPCAVKDAWIADLRKEIEVLRARLGLVLPKPATQLQPIHVPGIGLVNQGPSVADSDSPTPDRFQKKDKQDPAEARAAIERSFVRDQAS